MSAESAGDLAHVDLGVKMILTLVSHRYAEIARVNTAVCSAAARDIAISTEKALRRTVKLTLNRPFILLYLVTAKVSTKIRNSQ